MYEQTIYSEEFDGFLITVIIEDEDTLPEGQLLDADGNDDEEMLEKIDEGEYVWFSVRVTASRDGVDLGEEYLSGCCYKYEIDFVRDGGGEYVDMRAAAVHSAKEALAALNSEEPAQ